MALGATVYNSTYAVKCCSIGLGIKMRLVIKCRAILSCSSAEVPVPKATGFERLIYYNSFTLRGVVRDEQAETNEPI